MWLLCLFLGHLRFSAECPAAGYPFRVPHLSGSGWLTYSCSGRFLFGWRCLGTPLGFLPCASAVSPSAAYRSGFCNLLAPVCWSTPAVEPCCWVGGVLMRHMVFYHVPCSSSGACRLRSLPCSRFPWGFSGHRVSVLLLPW